MNAAIFGNTLYVPAQDIKIEEKLRAGGYGNVFICSVANNSRISADEASTPRFALKQLFIHKQTNYTFSYNEIDTLKKFDHPNIIEVIGFSTGEIRGLSASDPAFPNHRSDDVYLLFPLAKHDLSRYPDNTLFQKSEAEILHLFSQIVCGVHYIHQAGYMHRDIKPANILIMEDDTVRICDLGCAEKMYKYGYTGPGVGTYVFRAPEMLLPIGAVGAVQDYACDIWSLGCVFYFMISSCSIAYSLEKLDSNDHVWETQTIIDGYPFEMSIPEGNKLTGVVYPRLGEPTKVSLETFMSRVIIPMEPSRKNVVCRFLSRFLALDPAKRFTTAELTTHPYLTTGFPINAQMLGTDYSTRIPKDSRAYVACEPKIMAGIENAIFNVFLRHRDTLWYRDKILFTALIIFDRFATMATTALTKMTIADWEIYFKGCLYIASKYYLSLNLLALEYATFALPEVLPQDFPDPIAHAGEIERAIVYPLGGWIYDVSIYDLLTKEKTPTFEDVFSLLLFVLRQEHRGKTPEVAFADWKRRANHSYVNVIRHPRYEAYLAFLNKSTQNGYQNEWR